MNALVELLAEYAHTAWSGWMKYMFGKSTYNDDGSVTIPADLVNRWTRQMNTTYVALPEGEKKSDRKEAYDILILVKNWVVTTVTRAVIQG